MRKLFIFVGLLTINTLFGQNLQFEIEVGPNFSFSSKNSISLKYALPINPATGYSYKIFDNDYSRAREIGVGGNLNVQLRYKLKGRLYLISGLMLDYFTSKITTNVSSASYYKSSSNDDIPLRISENTNGYIPNDFDGNMISNLGIDDNGLPFAIDQNDFNKYTLNEDLKSLYLSIPIRLACSLSENFELFVGGSFSLLLKGDINTTYPYVDERIVENNISYYNQFFISIQGGISYKIVEKLKISASYQYSITDMIELNKIYEVTEGQKLNAINLCVGYIIN